MNLEIFNTTLKQRWIFSGASRCKKFEKHFSMSFAQLSFNFVDKFLTTEHFTFNSRPTHLLQILQIYHTTAPKMFWILERQLNKLMRTMMMRSKDCERRVSHLSEFVLKSHFMVTYHAFKHSSAASQLHTDWQDILGCRTAKYYCKSIC